MPSRCVRSWRCRGRSRASEETGRVQALIDDIFSREWGRVLAALIGVLGDFELAEDAAQEAFVRAYGSLHRFDTEREFRPWFLRILTNVAKNAVRTERRYVDVTLRATPPGAIENPDTITAAEQRAVLLRALMTLPERDRLILACRWFEEMTEKEIAVALDLKPGTVKSRLSRAMERLREQLTTEAVHD